MNNDFIYTPAVATDVMAMFKRRGWVPPSENPAIVAKWKRYQEMHLRQHIQESVVLGLPVVKPIKPAINAAGDDADIARI